jgi:hypothetical protein
MTAGRRAAGNATPGRRVSQVVAWAWARCSGVASSLAESSSFMVGVDTTPPPGQPDDGDGDERGERHAGAGQEKRQRRFGDGVVGGRATRAAARRWAPRPVRAKAMASSRRRSVLGWGDGSEVVELPQRAWQRQRDSATTTTTTAQDPETHP